MTPPLETEGLVAEAIGPGHTQRELSELAREYSGDLGELLELLLRLHEIDERLWLGAPRNSIPRQSQLVFREFLGLEIGLYGFLLFDVGLRLGHGRWGLMFPPPANVSLNNWLTNALSSLERGGLKFSWNLEVEEGEENLIRVTLLDNIPKEGIEPLKKYMKQYALVSGWRIKNLRHAGRYLAFAASRA